jgi:hypothetical protein
MRRGDLLFTKLIIYSRKNRRTDNNPVDFFSMDKWNEFAIALFSDMLDCRRGGRRARFVTTLQKEVKGSIDK